MDWAGIARAAVAITAGLLLGSVLPADLFARRRGVDIRKRGDGNPGTVNAVRVLGWGPGLITFAYDASVGVLAIQLAGLIGVSAGVAYAAGAATVVGHRFPVFGGFRGGGQGMAASAGMLVYAVFIAVVRGWVSMLDVALLAGVVAITFAVTRADSPAAVVMLPFLVVRVLLTPADPEFLAFACSVAGYIWIVQLVAARRWFAGRQVRLLHGRARH